MYFTREDYLKIEEWLKQNAIKDTEFKDAELPVKEQDTITLVQEGKNVKVSLKDFIDQLFNLGVSDFLNITDKYKQRNITIEQAISLIPSRARKKGQVITFLNSDGKWVLYQFKGELNQWNIVDLWDNIFDINKYIINSIIPDEEDLTMSLPDSNGNSYISLKDREYNPQEFSGKGRIILRKNIVEEYSAEFGKVKKNILVQDMINQPNTIYEIRYDFDLNGKEITIPEGCVLQFEGGSLSNGIIEFNNTYLKEDIKIYTNLKGTIYNNSINASWFGLIPYDISKSKYNYNVIKNVLKLNFKKLYIGNHTEHVINIDCGVYYIEGNNPFWINKTELKEIDAKNYYRRSGYTIVGNGHTTKFIMINNSNEEYWFGTNDDINFPPPSYENGTIDSNKDTSIIDNVIIRNITFESYTNNKSKVNGFHWRTYGMEKNILIENCIFNKLNKCFQIEGYGNGDHITWFKCNFNEIYECVILFNNNQSVHNSIISCFALIYKDFIRIGEYGGGDIYADSLSIEMYPLNNEDTKGAIVKFYNKETESQLGIGYSNNFFEFHHVRLESYGSNKSIVRNEDGFQNTPIINFYDSMFEIQRDKDKLIENYKDNTLIHITGKTIVKLTSCVLKECKIIVKDIARLYFDYCVYKSINYNNYIQNTKLLHKCCTCDYLSTIQCNNLIIDHKYFNNLHTLIGNADFAKGSCSNNKFTFNVSIQDPSQTTPTKIFLMPNIKIQQIIINKPIYKNISNDVKYAIGVLLGDEEIYIPPVEERYLYSEEFNKIINIDNKTVLSYPNNFISFKLYGTPVLQPEYNRLDITITYMTPND